MLVISNKQLALLEEAKLHTRLLDIARRQFPDAVRTLGHDAAAQRLRQAVRSAREIGLASDRARIA